MSPTRDEKKKMEATIHHGRLLPFALVGYLDSGLLSLSCTYIRILGVPGRIKKRVTIYLRQLLLDFTSQIMDKSLHIRKEIGLPGREQKKRTAIYHRRLFMGFN